MPLTNFPNGISSFGVPVLGSGPVFTTGDVFFVGSASTNAADSPAHGKSKDKPFATIDYAIGQCTASNDDHVIVLPGHSETITTDGGIALDVAGVQVIGVGSGALRPVIILDAAAAAVTVSAASCRIENFELRASFADVTNAIDVTAAWFHADRLEFTEEGADLNFVDYINCSSTTDNTADGLTVTRCRGTAIDAAQNSFVLTAADIDRLTVQGNYYSSDHGNTLAMIEVATGKTVTDVLITDNVIYAGWTTDVGGIANGDQTDNTGIVARNLVGHHDIAAEVLCDLDGVRQFENYGTATDTASGYILPAIDS